jgi:hypothetical protein
MMNTHLLRNFFILLLLVFFCRGAWATNTNLVAAQYNAENKTVEVAVRNMCQQVELQPSPNCSRTYPGQNVLLVKQTDRPDDEPCTKEALIIVSVPASELGCSPVELTIIDEGEGSLRLKVPGCNLQ